MFRFAFITNTKKSSKEREKDKEIAGCLVITNKTSCFYQELYQCKFLLFHFSILLLYYFLNILADKYLRFGSRQCYCFMANQ